VNRSGTAGRSQNVSYKYELAKVGVHHSLTVVARKSCLAARGSVRVCEKIAIRFTVTNRHRNRQPAPCGRGSASGGLRKSPILSRDHRERAGALNGTGYDSASRELPAERYEFRLQPAGGTQA